MTTSDQLSNESVRALVTAVNAGDRLGFYNTLATGAALSDDGRPHHLTEWAEREIFTTHGHFEIESESGDGLTVIANYRNDRWGQMPTRWTFTVDADGKISRIDTGQA
ncbi:nuclear transport factor 2 family protein [Nocardia africana]|uniref:Nuclear transport factor 2 family protein n=1 Tax=Nocardia africana TaxID=134964 RepID=A0ABW6NH66_9NOCA